MSLGKNQSTACETRATGSFNPSIQPRLAKQLQHSQNCQVDFLRRKNYQLQQRVSRMTTQIATLEQNKKQLLALNQKYVRVVNQYYRKKGKENKNANNTSIGNSLLHGLQRDHRNLVKHCLTMQQEIINYTREMALFEEMKGHLRTVNHTNTKELIQELRELSEQNRAVKKQNNQLGFDLQKSRQECCRLRSGKQKWQQKADAQGDELQRCQAMINTLHQENTDRSSAYQGKIYELQIKVAKLQEQLRKEQSTGQKNNDMRRKLQIAQVEHIHERARLRASLGKMGHKTSLSTSFYR